MSFLVWQRSAEARIASSRLVLRAHEVPLLQDAQSLRDRLERLCGEQEQRNAEAARQAREQGHALGFEQGQHEAAETLAAQWLEQSRAAADERERLRGEVGALALQVVRKLLGAFADDAVLVALADTAADDILPAQPLALAVHPDRCEAVRARLASAGTRLRCEVRGDTACAVDTCRIETEHGSVDVSLEVQLARLEAAWRAVDATEAA